MINKEDKIVITGAAGLVGQNLVLLLCQQGYQNIIAIDKHTKNLMLLKKINPSIHVVHADLAEETDWSIHFEGCRCAIILHAQITGLYSEEFTRNSLTATSHVIAALKKNGVSYTVHISSSVVNSVAVDDYTISKTEQENLIKHSGIKYCILRPTLMFGWFDPKHLGWLARFMEKVPIFPIPGRGKFIRQPLYSRDFCKIIIAAMHQQPDRKIFDIVGAEEIHYIDIIKTIKQIKQLKTWLLPIPYWLFYGLLKLYALFNKKPPFTADQLKALTAGDYFTGVDVKKTFGITPTQLKQALLETFDDPIYSQFLVDR